MIIIFYRGGNNDRLENVIFHSLYQLHMQDYLENFEKFGGTPIKGWNDGYLIPRMVANEDFYQANKRPYGIYHHAQGRARMESSLGELTRKFIQLIRDSKDNLSVDLNEAAGQLNV